LANVSSLRWLINHQPYTAVFFQRFKAVVLNLFGARAIIFLKKYPMDRFATLTHHKQLVDTVLHKLYYSLWNSLWTTCNFTLTPRWEPVI